MTVGLKGHVLNPAFPEGYSNWQETDPKSLIDAELVTEPTDKNVVKAVKKLAKEADTVVIATDFDREGELIGLEALREILAVNPGRRGHRQAGPLLGAHQGRDRARLRRARRALLPARPRRPDAWRDRPDLGRDPDPRGLARDPPLRLQLPLRRPRPEPDPRADRRARARAPSPRPEALLGGVREVRPPRGLLRGPPQDRQVLGEARGRGGARGNRLARRGHRAHEAPKHPQAADALQHDRVCDRCLKSARDRAVAGDADRRGPLHGRVHLLPADRQHRLSALAAAP